MSSQMSQAVVPRARRSGKAKRSRSAFEFKGRKNFARAVRKVVHDRVLEKKFSYQIYTGQEMDWDGHRHYLTEVGNGTGENDRVGRHITPQYLTARLWIRATNATNSTARSAWSVLLIQDKQQVGDSYATATEIITDIGTSAAPCGLVKAANRGRFKILRRWEGTLDVNTKNAEYLNIYHKFNGFVTKYNGTTAGDIESNGLMLLFVSSSDPADNNVLFTGHVRMWFTDA